MRKTIVLFLLLCTISFYAHSAVVYVDGLMYVTDTSNNTAALYGANGVRPSGTLIIPSSITVDDVAYSVTSIENSAFYCCSDLTGDLIIPNSVITIGTQAFAGCSGFTGNLTIGDSVTSIGWNAFGWCSGFTGDLTIGKSVTSIGQYAFTRCSGLTNILVDANNEHYSSIDGVMYNKDVSEIIYYPIGKSMTEQFSIPSTVTSIRSQAFYVCTGFTGDLIIPNTVTYIGSQAFYGCTGFTGDLIIGNSVTSIGDETFSGCSGFTGDLTIGNSVNSIGDGAFSGCSGFTGDLTIPNSVNSIGLSAFSECSGFTGELTIGNSVTSIGSKTFYNCSGFTGGLTIPNSITSIGVAAFGLCSGFTGELIIGNSVTTIGISAFESCDNFNKISCYATNPPSCYPGTTFSVDTESCVLVVPAGTLDDYKMASVWSTFINIVEDSTLAVEDNLVNDIMVYAVGSELMVSGAVDGAVVKVYSLNGAVVANGVVLDGAAQVELPATSGVYIVSVGNQSYKVVR